MQFPISQFDGYQLGFFTESDKQQTDDYTSRVIARWYGTILERFNKRTDFVTSRDIDFSTLRNAIWIRLDGLATIEQFGRVPSTLGENETRYMLRNSERSDVNNFSMGNMPLEIGNHPQILSGINELSIVTTIDRYAYKAPPEIKLQAAVELSVWIIRQPGNANRSNSIVRSGAATFLDAYRHRSI